MDDRKPPAALASTGAVLLALLLSGLGLAATGHDPLAIGGALLKGATGSPNAIGESLVKGSVLLLCALAVVVPKAAGLFNVGGQGQLLWGAFAAAAIGGAVEGPLALPLSLAGAGLAGALWGALPGWLLVRRGVHEVIATLLLDWTALHLIENGLVIGPFAARGTDAGTSVAGTPLIHADAHLPLLWEGTRLHAGLLVALLALVLIAVALGRSVWGLELRAIGAGTEAARASGLPVDRRRIEALAVGGLLAGLGGALVVLGTELRYPPRIASPFGFDGIALAFIGGNGAWGAGIASLFFGALRAGGTRLQLFHVHRDFPEVVQGIALLAVAAPVLWGALWSRLPRRREVVAP